MFINIKMKRKVEWRKVGGKNFLHIFGVEQNLKINIYLLLKNFKYKNKFKLFLHVNILKCRKFFSSTFF